MSPGSMGITGIVLFFCLDFISFKDDVSLIYTFFIPFYFGKIHIFI